MKKICLLLIPLLVSLTACNQNVKQTLNNEEENIYENYKPVTFDSSNIIVRAPILSDEHCERTSPINSSAQTIQGIKNLCELVGRTSFDAWLSGGDRSLTGKVPADEEWMNAYISGCSDSKTKLFFCHGNHDVCWSGCASRQEHYNYLKTYGMYENDEKDGQPEIGNRHKIINGVHFMALDIQGYNGTDNPVGTNNINWAKSVLNNIPKTSPVFMLTHVTAPNTIHASGDFEYDGYWGSSPTLANLCKDYPNIILLSGHIHYLCNSEATIWQGDYTAIGLPTIAGGVVEDYYFDGMKEVTEKTIHVNNSSDLRSESVMYPQSQGMYLEVDKDFTSRITRYDLKNKRQIGKPWIIPGPKADKSHLIPYSKGYIAATNKAPHIGDEEGNIIVNSHATGKLDVTWKKFEDDDLVNFYEVQLFINKHRFSLTPKSTPDERYVYLPHFWEASIPESYSYSFNTTVNRGDTFVVRIIAFDSYKNYVVALPTTILYLP